MEMKKKKYLGCCTGYIWVKAQLTSDLRFNEGSKVEWGQDESRVQEPEESHKRSTGRMYKLAHLLSAHWWRVSTEWVRCKGHFYNFLQRSTEFYQSLRWKWVTENPIRPVSSARTSPSFRRVLCSLRFTAVNLKQQMGCLTKVWRFLD